MLKTLPLGIGLGIATTFFGYHIFQDVANLMHTGCMPNNRWAGCGYPYIFATLVTEICLIALFAWGFYYYIKTSRSSH